MKDPAILLYTGDFLNGCTGLTMEERGQYITMLCLQHQTGHLSEKTISLSLGSVSVDVMDKFSKDKNGLYFNKRMDEEIQKRKQFIDSRRDNGKKGGRPKKPSGKPSEKLIEDENEIDNIIKIYNSTSFAKIQKLTDLRKTHLKRRIKENGSEIVIDMITRANKSDFLCGVNDRQWKADFDWLMNPNNFIKVIEGKFDNKKKVRVLA